MIGKKILPGKTSENSGGNPLWKRSGVRRFLGWTGLVVAVLALILVALFLVVSLWPGVGAQGADLLRGVIGDRAVAGLEMVVFQAQDAVNRWKYNLGLAKP